MRTYAQLRKDPLFERAAKAFLQDHVADLEIYILQLRERRRKVVHDPMRLSAMDAAIARRLLPKA